MQSVCIIPARMGSSRFPGKPMSPLLGMPMIEHIYHRCRLHAGYDRVIVATCDQVIADCITSAGGEAVMTSDVHERCTDRVQEAISNLKLDLADDDLVQMVQGDEILVGPEMLDEMQHVFQESGAPVVNLVSRLYRVEDHEDPNTVKVVAAPDGRLLYLSRAPIPSRARAPEVPMYQQTGVIAFAKSHLDRFSSLPQTPLEKLESVDMLRYLEHGDTIMAVKTEIETIGVDTEQDRARAESILADNPVTGRYLDRANAS